ncbi:MAG TPA: ABC transporter permease [Candidatus Acidoferrales bacterium]|nr:ABC transporter permease [Candidatus Acidoferrales bacterium]
MSIHFRVPLLKRLRSLLRRDRLDLDLDDELQFHLDQKTLDLVAAGLSPNEARRRARLDFGSLVKARESTRDTRGTSLFEEFAQDIRYALRMLRKSPVFTAVAVFTLALGIGANTAIFSAVNGIHFDPLPYPDSSRLVNIERRQSGWGFTNAEVNEIRQQCTLLDRLASYEELNTRVRGTTLSVKRWDTYVSPDFFPLLGMKPLLGRPILPADAQPGNDRVAVLSYRLWRDLFDSDAHILGRSILIGEDNFMVIGVMPKSFDVGSGSGGGEESFDGLWTPISPSSPDLEVRRGKLTGMIARLKQGVRMSQLNAQLAAISARLAAARPPAQSQLGGLEIHPSTLKHTKFPGSADPLLILFGAVGFVLLLACINLSALLLTRAWTRQHELAIRRTLGASRSRIVRQLLCEGFLMSAAGGLLGLLFAVWGTHAIRVFAPPRTPRLEHVVIDNRVFLFAAGISILAAFLFGLAPALQATSRRIGESLTGALGNSFAAPRARQRNPLRSALIICEVALALILAAGGALMARSLYKLMNLDTGTQADHVVSMSVQLSGTLCKKPEDADCALIVRSILDAAQAIPGVRNVAVSAESSPFSGGAGIPGSRYPGEPLGLGLYFEGEPGNRIARGGIGSQYVTPGVFSTLGMRLLAGRDFEPSDIRPNPVVVASESQAPSSKEDSKSKRASKKTDSGYWCAHDDPPVAIVSEHFAKEYFSGNPIGKHFTTCLDKDGSASWTQIIGVVNDVRDHSLLRISPGSAYYVPFQSGRSWVLLARTSTDPMPVASALARVVLSVDKGASVSETQTLGQIVAESASQPRFDAALLGSFGLLGLIIAMVGIFGVVAFSVEQRTHEIGVRMALGATPADALRMIVGQGMALVAVGIAIGLAGALALTRFLRSLLFEIKPNDPATFVIAAVALALAALAACYIPARRAMRVDPMVALRYE